MVVASGEERRPRRRAEGSGMETVIPQAICRHTFCSWGSAGTTEYTRCSKTHIVEQDNENIRCASRWTQLRNRRKLGLRIFRIIGSEANRPAVRNWQYFALDGIVRGHCVPFYRHL